MDKLEICKNCKYFKQHYYWCDGVLNLIRSGHCSIHARMRLILYKDYCEIWEPAENVPAPPNEALEDLLKRAVKQIADISAILKIRNTDT